MKVYDWQTKKKIVLEYINTDITYETLDKKYNMNGLKQIRIWVNKYKKYGEEGLKNKSRLRYKKEFKLQLVEEYLNTEKGYKTIAKEHGLASSQIRDWVDKYKRFGRESLDQGRREGYTKDFKLKAVDTYLTTDMSYREVVQTLGMKHKNTLADWVKKYREKGTNAF